MSPPPPRPAAPSRVVAISASKREPEESGERCLKPLDTFVRRHIGPDDLEISQMLGLLGVRSLDELIDQTIPADIRLKQPLALGEPRGEHELLSDLALMAAKNQVFRSFIGMGHHDCITPPVIQRNILENPGWYTQYTPYQAEISQGRLEALLNFQTMVSDLVGLPIANASLLDEATAAAEAMAMCVAINGRKVFIVSEDCHPQTIAVVQTRGKSMGIEVVVQNVEDFTSKQAAGLQSRGFDDLCGLLVQYPTTDGRIVDYSAVIEKAHAAAALVVCATDLLACTLIKPPGEWGADIAVGSSQRFGVPMGFGGPHAAFMATKNEYVRKMPGRLIGVSKDVHGHVAYRMAIQTREQHIKRERATSNICTAQVLLAIMAGMYAVYHGPEGLKAIADRVHTLALSLARRIEAAGGTLASDTFFDTLRFSMRGVRAEAFARCGINVRAFADGSIGIALDETATEADLDAICSVLGAKQGATRSRLSSIHNRRSPFLTHPVFNTHHSETEMLRYIKRLESRDLSLAQSMIPLGSCTMKLNGTSEMIPVTWPGFSRLHPYAPPEQWRGYAELFAQLEGWLAEITGFEAVSLQPNAGSQGEYAGLLAIRAYYESRGDADRQVCLIPVSAHGTNPASAVIAGMKVVTVACDEGGNVDLADLRAKAAAHARDLAALMITYPSTHGVFEEGISEICRIVHEHGGQVYMDGANMNAQVGLCRPGDIGADVCHLNLHKTFCIPHGGGGPGMGPIAVAKHLAPFLPASPLPSLAGRREGAGAVSAAPYGSASILPISWVYIALMGAGGLRRATEVAILSANYMAARLKGHYDELYSNHNGRVAHEFIIDCRAFEQSADIRVDDIAKRLMDYGFHAPTMSFPVPGTLMIEPTESESRAELDRLCDALIAIRAEIRAVEEGHADRRDNVLKGAPHTAAAVGADAWTHAYSREEAAFPAAAPWLRDFKFWPHVGRIDNPYGDRNLMCSCPPMSADHG